MSYKKSEETSRSRATTPTSHKSIGLLLLLLATNLRMASTAPLLLYEDVNFKGKTSKYVVGESNNSNNNKGECINLVGKLNDFFSSVDTVGGCFYLCENHNCRGKCEIIEGKIADLSKIHLNDRVSSIRMCSLPIQITKRTIKTSLKTIGTTTTIRTTSTSRTTTSTTTTAAAAARKLRESRRRRNKDRRREGQMMMVKKKTSQQLPHL